jgi:MoaA/NifB/PqqE/SkfB family radical SAM enzyme
MQPGFIEQLTSLASMGRRQLRWLAGDRSPFVATLKLTYRCNLSCIHCPWSRQHCDELSTEQWKDKIRQLRNRGVSSFVLEGGEPTSREDLVELIDFTARCGGRVILSTNGTRKLSGLRAHRFLISVDGLPATHDRIRGDGSYELMRRNAPSALGVKHALVTVSRLNRHEIPALMDPLLDVLDGFWFSFAYDYTGRDPIALGPEETREVGAQIAALATRYPVVNVPHTLSRVGTRRRCRPWLLTTVAPDGHETDGCLIEELEPGDCDRCELACHREVSDLMEPRAFAFHLRRFLRRGG